MKKDSGFVIKNSEGLYFTGYNQASEQLRKAKIYHSAKYAENTAKQLNTNQKRMPYVKGDFEVVMVEISEKIEKGRENETE